MLTGIPAGPTLPAKPGSPSSPYGHKNALKSINCDANYTLKLAVLSAKHRQAASKIFNILKVFVKN